MDTGDAVQAKVESLRAQCRSADLAIELYQRVYDEYFHAHEETDAVQIAFSNIESFEDVLEELTSIHLIEQVPATLAFADRTILAEVASTRANLEDCIGQCRATMRRMMEVLARSQAAANPEKNEGAPDAAHTLGSFSQMLQVCGEQRWIKR